MICWEYMYLYRKSSDWSDLPIAEKCEHNLDNIYYRINSLAHQLHNRNWWLRCFWMDNFN